MNWEQFQWKGEGWFNLDHLQLELQESRSSYLLSAQEKQNGEPTVAQQHIQINSRSVKKRQEDLELSFQQGFLDEHETAFENQAKNFIENSFPNTTQAENFRLKFWKLPAEAFLQYFNFDENQLLNKDQKLQFSKDLEVETKLNKLLSLIHQKTSDKVCHQLTYIAMLVWEKYVEVRQSYFKLSDIEDLAGTFADQEAWNLFQGYKLKIINYSLESGTKPENQLKIVFKEFIRFWALTVLLAIEEYFENPYLEGSCLKRKRSAYISEHESHFSFDEMDESMLGYLGKKCNSFSDWQA